MNAQAMPAPALRPFLPADVPELAMIFRASVEELTGEDYSEAQQEAWMAVADDEATFGARLAGMLTIVATIGGMPVGFAALKGADHIDMLYVHPDFARRGIGSALCDALEKLAGARQARRLTTDASDTALPFFEQRGYLPQHRNTVMLGEEWLGSTRMEKTLPAAGEGQVS
ncbi:GNAT family N-acetyltransferase [Chelatococcus composti]|jgi:putative acetyltransferase|uniref:Putative acetyltransferase n=1 Tax=Chelatococcus composti TaxID=1743235 RepID=A0A841K6W9_9HYPH|nr:GNAT family N-acetyltransferase [Chelatococcus composti]MBB6168257.1 putative acetyltransferase [Chelatococcus composti]MBS7736658.1 GNAT family N-acetyltransferase [Chelatococcus composti]PZN45298.1 MAG: GNAT family N-acetyltransferase [Pseudomonadota bacterium]GGG38698.1 GCN5 family acetyltransferase [Chelatococcus composti]